MSLSENKPASGAKTTNAEILTGAREKLASGWCQGWFARDKDGGRTDARSLVAASWCISGAVIAAGGNLFGTPYHTVVNLVELEAGRSVNSWNDDPDRTQAEVLALIDRAIVEVGRE